MDAEMDAETDAAMDTRTPFVALDATPTQQHAGLAALMARVALRDQHAFKQLYDDTSRCLFGIVLRLLRGNRAWAEEVLQEIYVAVWHVAPNYSAARSQPMTWLMAIARNKALDALRGTRGERRHTQALPAAGDHDDSDDDAAPDIVDERPGPLGRLEQSAESNHLRRCLDALDAPQRQAIALAFFDGLTHVELAAHMRQPLGTVKAWVRRGLEKLKPCLERCAAAARGAP